MEPVKLTLRRTTFLFTILVFLFTPDLLAQKDILDSADSGAYRADCLTGSPIEIEVNFDATGLDTVVIIDNIAGHRNFNSFVPEKVYEFCASNSNMCTPSTADIPGEFRIKFKYDGSLIDVNKLSFLLS